PRRFLAVEYRQEPGDATLHQQLVDQVSAIQAGLWAGAVRQVIDTHGDGQPHTDFGGFILPERRTVQWGARLHRGCFRLRLTAGPGTHPPPCTDGCGECATSELQEAEARDRRYVATV